MMTMGSEPTPISVHLLEDIVAIMRLGWDVTERTPRQQHEILDGDEWFFQQVQQAGDPSNFDAHHSGQDCKRCAGHSTGETRRVFARNDW
jgi:hypothetical protein